MKNQEIVPTEQSPVQQASVTNENRSPALSGCSLTAIVVCICCTIVALGGLYAFTHTVKHTEDKGKEVVDKAGNTIVEVVKVPFYFLKEFIDKISKPTFTKTIVITIKDGHRVAELNTYAQECDGEYTYTTTWCGSAKKLQYKQKYEVKYGIDLDSLELEINSPSFNYEKNKDHITVTSMTPVGVQNDNKPYIESQEGLWNKISDEERAKVEATALAKAKSTAEHNDAAKREALKGLVDILNQFAENDKHVDFRYRLD